MYHAPDRIRASHLPRILRFIFATESYGGHYGPEFVTYFDEQNTKIKNGTLAGELIDVSALMINKCVSFVR